MSRTNDHRGAEFIQATVDEHDQPRIIDAGRLTSAEPGQPPYPSAERVLKITVPVTPDMTGRYKLNLPIDRSREIDIDPCGYVQNEYFEDDEFLQRALVQTPAVAGPQVSGSRRQLLNIDLPGLLKLRDAQETDFELPEKSDLDRLRTLINTHERDCEVRGSHAHTLVNPETRSMEVAANAHNSSITIIGYANQAMPMRSVIYNELFAIVAERVEHPDIAIRLGVDRYRTQAGSKEYTLALEILEWLRDHPVPERLSYKQISELLTAAGYADHPIYFLTHSLYYLASGIPLEDVLYDEKLFNVHDTTPDEYYNRKKELLEQKNKMPFERVYEFTVETVTFQQSSNEVVKEWWVRDPPAVYPLPVIRLILLHRDIIQFSQNIFHTSYIPSTVGQTEVSANRPVGVGFRFQYSRNDLKHPYRLAMAGDDAYVQAMERITDDVYREHKRKVFNSYVDQSPVFENKQDIVQWISGAAPTDLTYNELVQWYQ